MAHAGGRPLKFKSVEELQEQIDIYFDSCFENVDVCTVKQVKPFTVTGLALALDTTRETLLDYEDKEEYSDTIKKAKLKIEAYAEEQLFLGKNTAGVIFNMINNYKGRWTNKTELDNNIGNKDDKPFNFNLSNITTEELKELLKKEQK